MSVCPLETPIINSYITNSSTDFIILLENCTKWNVENSFCGFCPDNITGTYMHMTWDCPEVNRFWWKVTGILSTLMDKTIPCSQPLLLLNDTSTIKLSINDRRILLAGLTAAKKLIVCRWKPPHLLSVKEWLRSYREIAQLELSTSRLRHVNSENILYWTNLLGKINCLI